MLKFNTVNIIVITILVIFGCIGVSYLYFIALLFCWLVLTTIGSFHIKWNYHITSLNNNFKIDRGEVSITFDDGPNEQFTPLVLQLLKDYNVKATFFCIGKNIEANPELFKKIIAEGHSVGNHTYSHDTSFGFFKTTKVVNELLKTNAIIKEHSGLEARLFRPPFGVTNPRINRALRSIKLQSIGWSIRSFDTTSKSSEVIINSIKKSVKNGDVILLHDTSEKTVAILEQLLIFLREKHMVSVTIPTLFNIKAYA